MTPTEDILARYKQTEKEIDDANRVIVVRNLRQSQMMAVLRMADTENRDVIGSYMVAASVVGIDELAYPFPKSRGEIDAVLDRLDREGMRAATKAYMKLNRVEDEPVDADAGA